MTSTQPRMRRGLAALLSLLLLAQGCAVQMPRGAAQQAIQDKQKAVVFFQVKPLVDGQPVDKHVIFFPQISRLASGAAPKVANAVSPTFTAFKENWYYLVLEPGAYRLSFQVGDDPRYAKSLADFWLDVPSGQSLVYLGTLNLTCPKVGWFGDVSKCTSIEVAQEPEAARAFAQEHFPDYGPLALAPLHPVRPDTLPPPALSAILPLGYLATAGKNLVTPDWVKRGVGRATGLGEGSHAGAVAPLLGLGGAYPPQGAAGLAVLYLAYLAVGSVVGAAAGKLADRKFQPCIQELSEEVQDLDLGGLLGRRMEEELTRYVQPPPVPLASEADIAAKAASLGLKTVLQLDLQRLQIRECQERGTFCLEAMARARLWDVAQNRPLRTAALVYSAGAPHREVPYELKAWRSAPCRPMEAFCGPDGRRLLREEIAAAFRALVERMLFEMGLLSREPPR